MEAKRKELKDQQQALENKMAEGYQTEQRKLIEKEKEAKRLEMLGRLRAQSRIEDLVSCSHSV